MCLVPALMAVGGRRFAIGSGLALQCAAATSLPLPSSSYCSLRRLRGSASAVSHHTIALPLVETLLAASSVVSLAIKLGGARPGRRHLRLLLRLLPSLLRITTSLPSPLLLVLSPATLPQDRASLPKRSMEAPGGARREEVFAMAPRSAVVDAEHRLMRHAVVAVVVGFRPELRLMEVQRAVASHFRITDDAIKVTLCAMGEFLFTFSDPALGTWRCGSRAPWRWGASPTCWRLGHVSGVRWLLLCHSRCASASKVCPTMHGTLLWLPPIHRYGAHRLHRPIHQLRGGNCVPAALGVDGRCRPPGAPWHPLAQGAD